MTLNSKQGTDRKQKKMQKAKKLVYIKRTQKKETYMNSYYTK